MTRLTLLAASKNPKITSTSTVFSFSCPEVFSTLCYCHLYGPTSSGFCRGTPVSSLTSQPHKCHHHPLSHRDLMPTTIISRSKGIETTTPSSARVFSSRALTRKQRNPEGPDPKQAVFTVPLLVRRGRGAGGGGHDSSTSPAPPRATAAERARPQGHPARFYWSIGPSVKSCSL